MRNEARLPIYNCSWHHVYIVAFSHTILITHIALYYTRFLDCPNPERSTNPVCSCFRSFHRFSMGQCGIGFLNVERASPHKPKKDRTEAYLLTIVLGFGCGRRMLHLSGLSPTSLGLLLKIIIIERIKGL